MITGPDIVEIDIGFQDLDHDIECVALDELLLQADGDHAVVIAIRRVVWTSWHIVILVGEEGLRCVRNRVLLADGSLGWVLVAEQLNEIGVSERLDIARWLQELMMVAIVHFGSELSLDEQSEAAIG